MLVSGIPVRFRWINVRNEISFIFHASESPGQIDLCCCFLVLQHLRHAHRMGSNGYEYSMDLYKESWRV